MSLIPLSANSQIYELPVACGSLTKGVELLKKYEEVPIFVGKDLQQEISNLNITIFHNKEKGSYTVTLISRERGTLCAISSGEGMIIPEKPSSR